jgi:hypothetical protein
VFVLFACFCRNDQTKTYQIFNLNDFIYDVSIIIFYKCLFFSTVSKDWHHAGKDKSLRCTDCRLYFKRYGEERPLDSPKGNPSSKQNFHVHVIAWFSIFFSYLQNPVFVLFACFACHSKNPLLWLAWTRTKDFPSDCLGVSLPHIVWNKDDNLYIVSFYPSQHLYPSDLNTRIHTKTLIVSCAHFHQFCISATQK